MKIFGLFALAAAGLIGAAMAALMLLFQGPGERAALAVTAAVAFAVHLEAFALARLLRRRNEWAAWLAGSLNRLLALLVYAFVVVKVVMLPVAPALIGCATFLFLPTLIEPLLLLK